jgi:hypothetical protein
MTPRPHDPPENPEEPQMTTALLVLDMLADFTSGKLVNPAAQQITEPFAAGRYAGPG